MAGNSTYVELLGPSQHSHLVLVMVGATHSRAAELSSLFQVMIGASALGHIFSLYISHGMNRVRLCWEWAELTTPGGDVFVSAEPEGRVTNSKEERQKGCFYNRIPWGGASFYRP